MSHIENKMLLLAVILIICGVSNATVYTVGDSAGWTTLGNVNYTSWAASKQFHVGDTIVFNYSPEHHNVVRVSHKNFKECNATDPISTWTSGSDKFTIQRTGHYFFTCSTPNHCEAGQKVDIRVADSTAPKQPPTPMAPAPAPSSATRSWTKSSFLVAAIVSIFWF